ncbi:mandelate racemase/muconate lactonizing enzyme family protein [Variovorax sp. KK3]|nr:enolase C-terminal domain-like protein [Variovorax sp. KK3]
MKIDSVCVRQLHFPLVTPYKVSLLTMREFDPFVVEVRDTEGRSGFGEALIVPGYTTETVEGSWRLCCTLAERIAGLDAADAAAVARSEVHAGVGAASAVLAALDMLAGHEVLRPVEQVSVPLLAPLHSEDPGALAEEIEQALGRGFRTLKVKVGFAWQRDLDQVETIQRLVAGRATLRLDANQGFDSADGIAFAKRLTPQGIELFEQPCLLDDWRANAAVAAASRVPVMLDESIYDESDIDRAAGVAGVGFVKLKLKKIGSVDMLLAALGRIRALGLTPVLGDGVSLEIGCWMEACIAVRAIDNAGEMNGFLKTRERIFENPLPFAQGAIQIPAGYAPRIDRDMLVRSTLRESSFAARAVVA